MAYSFDNVIWVGAAVLVSAILFFIYKHRRSQKKGGAEVKATLETTLENQKKKRRHFGFGKNKNKKNDAEAEEKENAAAKKETPGKNKKNKKKNNVAGKDRGKNMTENRAKENLKADSSESESAEDEELAKEGNKPKNKEIEKNSAKINAAKKQEPIKNKTNETEQKSIVDRSVKQKKMLTSASNIVTLESMPLRQNEAPKIADSFFGLLSSEPQESAKDFVGKSENEVVISSESSSAGSSKDMEVKAKVDKHESDMKNGEAMVAVEAVTKAAKKKKKNKSSIKQAVNGVSLNGVTPLCEEQRGSNERLNEENNEFDLSLDESEEQINFATDMETTIEKKNKKEDAEVGAATVLSRDSVNDSKRSTKGETSLKVKELLDVLNRERNEMGVVRSAVDQLAAQLQEEKSYRVQAQYSLDQKTLDANNLRRQLMEVNSVVQQMKEENRSLTEATNRAMQQASSNDKSRQEIQKLEQKVKIMDDALKQAALQSNNNEKGKKDVELREKRHLERINMLESIQTKMTEEQQASDQRHKTLSSELQRMTVEFSQTDKMRNHFREVEKQKLDMELVLKQLKAENSELMNINLQKDVDIQNEFSRMNRELESRRLERDAVHQQLRQREAEFQLLHQREADWTQSEAERMRLLQKEAEFAEMEARMQVLMTREVIHNQNSEDLTAAREQLASVWVELEELRRKEMDLNMEIDQLKQQRDSNQMENMTFEEEKSKMNDNIDKLFCDNKTKENEIEDLHRINKEIIDRSHEFQTKLAEMEKSTEVLTQIPEDLNKRLEMADNLQKELDVEKLENRELKEKVEQMKIELLERLEASESNLKDALQEKDQEIERLTTIIQSRSLNGDKNTTDDNENLRSDVSEAVVVPVKDDQHLTTTSVDENRIE